MMDDELWILYQETYGEFHNAKLMEMIDQLHGTAFEEFRKHCIDGLSDMKEGPPYHFLQTYYQMSHGPLDDMFPKLCFPCAASERGIETFHNKIEAYEIRSFKGVKQVYRDKSLRCGQCKSALFIISKNVVRSHIISSHKANKMF